MNNIEKEVLFRIKSKPDKTPEELLLMKYYAALMSIYDTLCLWKEDRIGLVGVMKRIVGTMEMTFNEGKGGENN
jgi:hypothetical protein